jgi:hemoglobin-like flavoprotein
MNIHQIKIVKESFALVGKIPVETVGELFYNRLFEIAPEVKPMFGNANMADQSRKLISMLAYIINKLDTLDAIIEEVAKLAKRHIKYGVEPKHYQPVGAALLWTLEKGLGTNWNTELAEAWTLCYGTLSGAMITACEETSEVIN